MINYFFVVMGGLKMNFRTFSHRNAETLFSYDERYQPLYQEVCSAIHSISERDIVDAYNTIQRESKKSISQPINNLIKERLTSFGWAAESPIFEDPEYNNKKTERTTWRLDFAKEEISIEVAFNHGEATSWNLLKPVMASELNHVKKAIQTSAGIIICATKDLKTAGNFDGAVAEYEKILRYLKPMYNLLTAPLLIIGLEAPSCFHIDSDSKSVIIDHDLDIDQIDE